MGYGGGKGEGTNGFQVSKCNCSGVFGRRTGGDDIQSDSQMIRDCEVDQ